MPVAVSILRGVNVGGHHKIKMDGLRALYQSIGFRKVETYIQSGNVVFELKAAELKSAAKRIEDAIEKQYSFRVGVVLRTAAELRQSLAGNPFADRKGMNPAKLLICFLAAQPAANCAERLAAIKVQGEEIRQAGSELFIYFPDGQGKSKLTMAMLDKAAGTFCTGRNLNTVEKLLEMAERIEAER
jgi:uncharacterized protein (DUF1697 family)